jgi:hypothetical protein
LPLRSDGFFGPDEKAFEARLDLGRFPSSHEFLVMTSTTKVAYHPQISAPIDYAENLARTRIGARTSGVSPKLGQLRADRFGAVETSPIARELTLRL